MWRDRELGSECCNVAADPLGRALVQSNVAIAAFNLLPIPPLDGVEAWRLLFRRGAGRLPDLHQKMPSTSS
jgi:Zn-dependent protease